jgi:site-specific recombinase XerD
MTKAEAQIKLDAEISKTTAVGERLTGDSTLRQAWQRFSALQAASWSPATRRVVCSVFEEAPEIEGKNHKPRKHPSVLAILGDCRLGNLTRAPLQECLNHIAAAGASYSIVHKARTYLAACLEYAVDEQLITSNPARKIQVPTQMLPDICERFYSLAELKSLSAQAHGRERIILRIFTDCGLRPQELFALRADDVQPLQLRIDEALKERERGEKRIGNRTKTMNSKGYVAISADLERELRSWIEFRGLGEHDLLFPSEADTPFRISHQR